MMASPFISAPQLGIPARIETGQVGPGGLKTLKSIGKIELVRQKSFYGVSCGQPTPSLLPASSKPPSLLREGNDLRWGCWPTQARCLGRLQHEIQDFFRCRLASGVLVNEDVFPHIIPTNYLGNLKIRVANALEKLKNKNLKMKNEKTMIMKN